MRKLYHSTALVFMLLGMVINVFSLSGSNWVGIKSDADANDFASYYFAAQAAINGNNPYDPEVMLELADNNLPSGSAGVNPYFYPPPFLFCMLWVAPLDLNTGHRIFYWASAAFLFLFLLVWWRFFPGPSMAVASGFILATYTPVFDSLRMGQANLLVLAIMTCGVLFVELSRSRREKVAGGLLVGLACMMKMSPAIIVIWWLVRREWHAVLAAGGAAVFTSVLALPLVGLEFQGYFYREVLLDFFSSAYHGLTVPFNLPMNHSILNFWTLATQGFHGVELSSVPSTAAKQLAGVTVIGCLGFLLYTYRDISQDLLRRVNAAGAFFVLMVLSTSYTFEHHLVFLLFPIVAVFLAWSKGRLPRNSIWLLGSVYAALAFGLAPFKLISSVLGGGDAWSPVAVVFRETKFLAALCLGVLCVLASNKKPEMSARKLDKP